MQVQKIAAGASLQPAFERSGKAGAARLCCAPHGAVQLGKTALCRHDLLFLCILPGLAGQQTLAGAFFARQHQRQAGGRILHRHTAFFHGGFQAEVIADDSRKAVVRTAAMVQILLQKPQILIFSIQRLNVEFPAQRLP